MIIKITNGDRVELLDVNEASKEIFDARADARVTTSSSENRIDVRYDSGDNIIYLADNFDNFSLLKVWTMIRKVRLEKSA